MFNLLRINFIFIIESKLKLQLKFVTFASKHDFYIQLN
jgi:hypothetical protein